MQKMCELNFEVGKFGDKRLDKVGALFFQRMLERVSVCLKTLGGGRANEVRFGRWLRNDKVAMKILTDHAIKNTAKLCEGRDIIAIQDTSEINYQKNANRVSGLARVGNNTDQGYFMHPMLALDAGDGSCLGVASFCAYLRKAKIENRWDIPIEKKESMRWINSALDVQEALKKAKSITIVADRESDIYEYWDRIPDEKTSLITRACRDRKLEGGERLYSLLDALPVQSIHECLIRPRHKKRKKRLAKMEIRFTKVKIPRPKKKSTDKNAAHEIEIYAVDIRESQSTKPKGEALIHWRLLTTRIVETEDAAIKIVEIYEKRWDIEQLFRSYKSKGLNIEQSHLENGESLMKLGVLGLIVAVKSIQLVSARDGNTDQKVKHIFTQKEIACMRILVKKVEGKTAKQKNPYPLENLAWASWIMARLGGWNGYKSESPPGPIKMSDGLKRFEGVMVGYDLFH